RFTRYRYPYRQNSRRPPRLLGSRRSGVVPQLGRRASRRARAGDRPEETLARKVRDLPANRSSFRINAHPSRPIELERDLLRDGAKQRASGADDARADAPRPGHPGELLDALQSAEREAHQAPAIALERGLQALDADDALLQWQPDPAPARRVRLHSQA